MELIESIWEKELFLPYIIGIMVVGGLIKNYGLLNEVFVALRNTFKSNRLVVAATALAGGVLPIEGRVIMSAPLLDSIASDKAQSRSKFGIVDYLSTHHYYWWSPLEKTVVLPMAALGLSYTQMLGYTLVPLLITLGFAGVFIFKYVKETDVEIIQETRSFSWNRLLKGWAPIVATMWFLVCYGDPDMPYLFSVWFGGLAAYYSFICNDWKWGRYINWKFTGLAAIVLALAAVFSKIKEPVMEYLHVTSAQGSAALVACSVVGFLASFAMGSSGKYAGIVSLLAKAFGVQYLTWFLCVEYAGYIISPMHKCLMIGQQYFGTPIRKYYSILIWLILALLGWGAITLAF
ncbi:MAG: DUF401 family protein [Candidatus Nanopelagicaceae bacterium]